VNAREAAIDPLLASWDERLRRVDENLLALEAEPTYQMLAGAPRAPLDGVTRARIEPALDALAQLFEQRVRLTEVLERAKAIRATFSSLWGNDEKVAEIERLLHGPSIKVSTRHTPLAQRSLLDAATSDIAWTPEDLLHAMAKAFEAARDAVLDVKRAWARLEPAIEKAERDVVALRRKAESLGDAMQVDTDLLTVERELAVLRGRVARDPLGAAEIVGGALLPEIDAVRARIEAQARARVEVTQMLAVAVQVRRALDDARVRADAARGRVASEFVRADIGPHVDASLIEGLDVWLAKIEGTARAGRWSSAVVGLGRWLETAESYLATERGLLEAAAALASKHAELAGRLSARRAQLAAVSWGAADPALDELARAAEEVLRQKPVALDLATVSVEAFEARMGETLRALKERK